MTQKKSLAELKVAIRVQEPTFYTLLGIDAASSSFDRDYLVKVSSKLKIGDPVFITRAPICPWGFEVCAIGTIKDVPSGYDQDPIAALSTNDVFIVRNLTKSNLRKIESNTSAKYCRYTEIVPITETIIQAIIGDIYAPFKTVMEIFNKYVTKPKVVSTIDTATFSSTADIRNIYSSSATYNSTSATISESIDQK